MVEVPERKKCTKCLVEKSITEFSKRSAAKDGHSYVCKECEQQSAKASYARRKDEKAHREYYQAHREERLEHHKKYYLRTKDERLAHHHEYQKNHPEVMSRAGRKRRAAMKKTREPYVRNEVVDRDSQLIDGKMVPVCWVCSKPIEKLADLHLDHVIPIGAEGGTDTKDNVKCAHSWCNVSRPKDGRDLASRQ